MPKKSEQITEARERVTSNPAVSSAAEAEHPMLHLQRAVGNQAALGLLEAKLSRESEDRAATDSTKLSSTSLAIQRAPKTQGMAAPAKSAGGPQFGRALLVDDDAATLEPGQMRKRAFLSRLRASVCNTANEALAEAGRTVEGCPYIDKWLSFYEGQDPAHIERALRKYAPETAGATSAEEYIPAVNNRVRRAVATWVRTGQLTGLPDEIAAMMGGGGADLFDMIAGLIGSAVSAAISGIGRAVSSAASAVGGFFSGVGRALFKRKDGRSGLTRDPQGIRSQLGRGQNLEGSVSSRMSAAFGQDFSHVRVHTDAKAAGLSDSLNARAFTIGGDVAFGSGEYRPGTPIGDALIAHELAHVVQQRGAAKTDVASWHSEEDATEFYEREADVAAANAVATLHGGKQLGRPRSSVLGMPRLQSCSKKKPPQIRVPIGAQVTPEQADQLLIQDSVIGPRIKERVAKGRKATGHTHELDTLEYLQTAKDEVYGEAINPRTQREYTLADISYDMMYAGGFQEGSEIYLHRPGEERYLDLVQNGQHFPIAVPSTRHPATIVHETIHLYGSDAWKNLLARPGNEGATEFFTRHLLSKQENPGVEDGATVFKRDSYPQEFEATQCLVKKSSIELLADAYFLGKIEPLRQKVGAANFDAWVAAMKVKNFNAAHAALGCAPPKG